MMTITSSLEARHAAGALAIAALIALGGCQGSGAFATLQQNLAGLNDQQTQILAKLDSLDKKVDGIEIPAAGAAPAAPGRGDAAKPAGPQPGKPDPAATYRVDLDGAHWTGGENALVTVVAWSDFQCPYCQRVGPTMETLKKDYGDDIKIAFKHNPLSFHNRAMAAATAAEAAGKQGKFWEMHDKLFENNKDLTDENFAKWAGEIGLDVDQFEKDLTDKALAEKITKQQAQGMTLGARGTPAFFVNGRFLSGAQPVDAFKAIIDEEKKKAEALVARGTPRARVYEAVVASGKTKV